MTKHEHQRDRQRHAGDEQRGKALRRLARTNSARTDGDPIGQASIADRRNPDQQCRQRQQAPPTRGFGQAQLERRKAASMAVASVAAIAVTNGPRCRQANRSGRTPWTAASDAKMAVATNNQPPARSSGGRRRLTGVAVRASASISSGVFTTRLRFEAACGGWRSHDEWRLSARRPCGRSVARPRATTSRSISAFSRRRAGPAATGQSPPAGFARPIRQGLFRLAEKRLMLGCQFDLSCALASLASKSIDQTDGWRSRRAMERTDAPDRRYA